MIWGVYIEIYILWEFGYLIDSPLILYIYSTTDRKKRFTEFGVWITAVILFVIFIVFGWIVMNKTYLGRNIYALGGNKEAARLAGINVNKLTVLVYSFAGFAASIAAIIMVARTNASQPGAGSSYAFDCMTAASKGAAVFE